jgi:hypothetical protein
MAGAPTHPPRRRKRRGNVAAARRALLEGLRATGEDATIEARKSAHALAAVLRAQGNEADAAEVEASVA